MRPDRLAVYSFAFMPEVLKHQKRLPAEALPDQPTKLGLFRAAFGAFVAAGYRPIGMDHFALPDDELAKAHAKGTLSRNFQGYTVQAARDVVAFGASAISDLDGAFVQNVRNLVQYAKRLESGSLATDRGLALTTDDARRARIIRSLMCRFEVELDAPLEAYGSAAEQLLPLEHDGLVKRDGQRLQITPIGRLFVRNVAMAFDAYLGDGGPRRFSRTV
jgi:oxygen-independent coproporphyrinogen-3 oxidase